jgi:hypothetical protein
MLPTALEFGTFPFELRARPAPLRINQMHQRQPTPIVGRQNSFPAALMVTIVVPTQFHIVNTNILTL